jgi:ssDNA-binding Zn-finger/Zn-ribbon topoisomerase 1
MIENFSAVQFESALPGIGGAVWQRAGTDNGQLIYTIRPATQGCTVKPVFGLMVWSSIDPVTLVSSAEPGCDSIRAVCCRFNADGSPVHFGGKAVRWTDRRRFWQDRLRAVLVILTSQLKALRPCPHCGTDLVPLTVKQGDNKGRPFVACTHKPCPGRKRDGKPDSAFGHFEFTDEMPSKAPSVAQDERRTENRPESQPSAPQGQEGPKTAVSVPCDVCGRPCRVFTAGPTTKNAGKRFISCDKGRGGCGRWTLITEEEIEGAQVYG